MTVSFISNFGVVATIPNGSSVSNIIASTHFHDASLISIQAPGTLDALTFTIEVSQDGTTFATLHDGAADIAPPAAGKARVYTELLAFNFFRFKSSGNVAADRSFLLTKQHTT